MKKQPVRLYNISQDPHEKVNLAEQYPEIVIRLRLKIENWYPLRERNVIVIN